MAKNAPNPLVTGAALDALPVLPLRDVVVYPHMVIPLFVGRDTATPVDGAAPDGGRISS